jgi:hypothetical protein
MTSTVPPQLDRFFAAATRFCDASIAGDLGDIYGDHKEGLVLWELGYWRAACWQWRFLYYMHWGEHLVGALRACYWVVRTHPDLA